MLNKIFLTIRLFVALICIVYFLFPSPAAAKPKSEKKHVKPVTTWNPTFSSELTFGSKAQADQQRNSINVMTPANMAALTNYFDLAADKIHPRPDVKFVEYEEGGDKFGADLVRVRYNDGWGFDVTLDPRVLEVILKPFTVDQMGPEFEQRLQRDVFEIMEQIGLSARVRGEELGGGHVHAGMRSTFGAEDTRLFRNQVVDFANHPEFGMGAMDDDPDNARSLIGMGKGQRQKLAKWVRRVDAGHFNTVRSAATALMADVMLDGKPATGKNIMAAKYWALNFNRMGYLDTWDHLFPNETWTDYVAWAAFDEVDLNERTLEYRAVRAPRNASEAVGNIRLFHARLKYMRELDKNIPLHPNFIKGTIPTTKEKVERYFNWIKATGLNPADYIYQLPSNSIEVRDYKDWHRHFLMLARNNGLEIPTHGVETKSCTALLGRAGKRTRVFPK